MKISKKTRDFIAFLVGGAVVIGGTLLLVAMANGWQYDFATGEITETGLVLMGSEPTGANITLNNKLLNQKTNYRYASAPVGEYTIRFDKTGFRPWTSQTTVLPGEVTFIEHAWLIPNEIPTRSRYTDLKISDGVQTRDRKRFVFVDTPIDGTGLRLVTTTDLTQPVEALATSAQLTAAAGAAVTSLDSLQFSDDNSQILVRALLVDGSAAWLVMPVGRSNPSAIVNLSKSLLISPSWISWAPRGNNDIVYTEKGVLRRAQIREKKLSEALAENVIFAQWSQEWLTYITQQTLPQSTITTQKLSMRQFDDANSKEIATIEAGQNFDIRYFRSLDRDYLALLNKDTKLLSLYTNVLHNQDRRLEAVIGRNVSAMTVSNNGRFLVHNANSQMVTIDFERFTRYRHAASLEGLLRWSWTNDQHLAMLTESGLKLIDYDGQNSEVITTAVLATSPILFSENKSLLALTTSGGNSAPALQHFFLDPEKILE